MSTSWQTDVTPAPAILVLPPAAVSLDEAHAAIELWEHYSGKRLDPAQRLVVEVMMAQTAEGRWAASTTGREMPRQNGKGDEVEVVELWGLVQRGEAILHTIHDAVLLATQTQERMLAVLEGHADLRRRVKRRWMGTGQQMIELHNGGVVWYRTRTGGGGRGVDQINRLVVDEAQHATSEQLAAMSPTLFASTDPQMNVLGTSALAGKSDWWWSVRKRAISGDPGSFGYVGHTAERVSLNADGQVVQERPDIEDRSVWLSANPAVHAGRGGGLAFLEEQFQRLGPDRFSEEHLGVWSACPQAGSVGPIDLHQWNSLAQVSQIDRARSWALAVSSDREWAALGIAGVRSDGRFHVEFLAHQRGTGWVLDRVEEAFMARRIPIRVCTQGSESGYIDRLRDRGVEVVEVSSSDYARATGSFIQAANDGELVHLGQPTLTRALERAAEHKTAAGVSSWVEGTGEITPLKAVTVALGGVSAPAKQPLFVGVS